MAVFFGLLLGVGFWLFLLSLAWDAEGGSSWSPEASSGDDEGPGHAEIVESHYEAGFLQVVDLDHIRSQLAAYRRSFPLILREGEVVLAWCSNAAFAEERSERFYGGGSVRVVRDVRVYAGGARSIPTLTPIDRGPLFLTNRRLVFTGQLRNLEVALTQLTGLCYEPGTLEIYKAGRAKKLHFEADECTTAIGSKIDCLLRGDDWRIQRVEGGLELLVRSGTPMYEPWESAEPAAADDGGLGRAIAGVLAAMVMADGTLEPNEVAGLDAALEDPELDLAPELYKEVRQQLHRLLRELRAGSTGPFLEESIQRLLQEPVEFRSRLWQLCSGLIQFEGEVPMREMKLAAYLCGRLVPQRG